MQRERNVIETEWELIDENIQRHHITTIQGAARFVDAHTLEVHALRHRRRAVSPPTSSSSPRARARSRRVGYALDDEVIVDSDSLLMLQRIPALDDRRRRRRDRLRVRLHLRRARRARHGDQRARTAALAPRPRRERRAAPVDDGAAQRHRVRQRRDPRPSRCDGRRAAVTLARRNDHRRRPRARRDAAASATRRRSASRRSACATNAQVVRAGRRELSHRRAEHLRRGRRRSASPRSPPAAMEQARVAVCHAFDLRYKRAVSSVLPYTRLDDPRDRDRRRERGVAARARRRRFEVGTRQLPPQRARPDPRRRRRLREAAVRSRRASACSASRSSARARAS